MIKLFNGLSAFRPVQFTASLFLILFLTANGSLANEKVILALGDSLTAGFGLAEEESFPAQLEKALVGKGQKVRVINGGLSGDTTTGGLSRLDWLLSENPDLIIIELGANDGLRALSPDLTRQNLDQLILRSKATGATVLLTGMKALPNLGRDYVQQFDAIFPALAEKHGVHFYPFFLDGVAADPTLNQQDGIHPTGEGIAIIVDRILPFVEEALTDTGAEG
ncbi:arylesterase [Aestuariispira insulae]|uniref:Acyl-CoA thioesterase-1 n=1 Tax=Aestuariispira insulae TaxID=1461337 RepID=A0A3D9HF14_9PROT|nr:arylesterase [Aestuariispira insulae]RED48077.1 acyl-CoA thioesterase-1 [Aestuariispira insulae]